MVAPASSPHTLTQMLRDWDDDALVRLLVARPDLARPMPDSLSQVASRATTRQSVADAVADLNAFDLWVARLALKYPDGCRPVEVNHPTAPHESVQASLRRLLEVALVWGDEGWLRPVRALGTVLGERPVGDAPSTAPPSFEDSKTVDPGLVEQAGAGSAFELIRRIEVAVEHCDHGRMRLRANGQPSVRDLRLLAEHLDVPQDRARPYLELALAAGLLTPSEQQPEPVVMPTTEFDSWLQRSLADQWAVVARGWWNHHPGTGPGRLKQCLVAAFGDPEQGRVLGVDDLMTWLRWNLPLRATHAVRHVTRFVDQAPMLGITALGALSPFGRGGAADRLAALLPERVHNIVVQADLTAVAPGPLTANAARELAALADVESRGGATVYRFSTPSLRRAHVDGWTAQEIEATLRSLSTTRLPQALRYLIADLERRPAGERRSAPSGPDRHRSNRRLRPSPSVVEDPAIGEPEVRAVVARLRQRAADRDRARLPESQAPAELVGDSPLTALREAVETQEVVWFGFVDSRGGTGERLVHALSIDDGRLRARDARSDEALIVPVHRITSAHIIRRR